MFVIGTRPLEGGRLSLSANPHVHTTEDGAYEEATRLARGIQSKEFIVFEARGSIRPSEAPLVKVDYATQTQAPVV
jgi:hypothetical protein